VFGRLLISEKPFIGRNINDGAAAYARFVLSGALLQAPFCIVSFHL